MKQAYCIFFALLLVCMSGVEAFSQGKSRIGKAAEISQLYKNKVKPNQSQRSAASEVRHQLPGNKSISLSVRSSKANKNDDFYYGEVANSRNSTFFLQVSGNRVTGEVIMPDQKRFYRFTSDATGEVYLQEEDIDKVLCVGYAAPKAPARDARISSAKITVPKLESLPGATAVVLLDYDGHYVKNTIWNSAYTEGKPIEALPMHYSESEIRAMWTLISADFSAFDLNITTSEEVFNRAPANKRARVIFTPTNFVPEGPGGIAYIGSFIWGDGDYGETPSFVWNTGVVEGGNSASHEIGHMLHLVHDGRTEPLEEYYWGNGRWVPIMGASFLPFAQWSKGDYPFANNEEDDLFEITTKNGFDYRADDHSNHTKNATTLVVDGAGNVSATSNKGNISTSNDVDVFSFETAGGAVSLRVQPTGDYSNLNPKLSLRNEKGQLIRSNDIGQPYVALEEKLRAGKYFLSVEGSASIYGAPSKYGSLGEYTISGFIPAITPVLAINLVSPASGTYFKAAATVELQVDLAIPAATKISKVNYYHGKTLLGTVTKAPYTYTWKGVKKGDYKVYAQAFSKNGETFRSDAIDINVINGYGGGSRNTCELPGWQPDMAYVSGALVSLNNNVYEAQRTSTGSSPAQSHPAKGNWKFRGPCRGAIASNNKPNKAVAFTADDIRIYPNPARNKGVLQVDLPVALKDAQVTLQEVGTGAKVMERNYQNVSNLPIQLTKLPPGYYVLRIVSDDQVWTRKLIINP